jgi:hypothetical protein
MVTIIIATNTAVNWLGHNHYSKDNKILDIFQDALPDLHEYEGLMDSVILAFVFSLFFIKESNKFFWNFAIRILLILLIRAITTVSTILPKHETCTIDPKSIQEYLRGGCYDKIFSGHMAIVVLFSLMYYSAGIFNGVAFWLTTVSYGIFTIASRAHYTADVVLAFLITYLVYDGDYTAINTIAKPAFKMLFGSH